MRAISTALTIVIALVSPSVADGPVANLALDDTARADANRLATRIDELLDAAWTAAAITPAAPADDAEFLRRVYLDIAGRIPTVAEVREFLADQDPLRRAALVERLLASPEHVGWFSRRWLQVIFPESNDLNVVGYRPQLDRWLRWQVARGNTLDQLVRELVAVEIRKDAPIAQSEGNGFVYRRSEPGNDDLGRHALAYFRANQVRPADTAARTARAFLGVRVECAQCHDHPFADWKQQDFWALAAFFASLREGNDDQIYRVSEDPKLRAIKIDGTEQVVPAAFLGGEQPKWPEDDTTTPRQVLADWLTSKDNPYFARASANRIWWMFFGRGLVEPVDDFDEHNAPSHPELLDELATELAAHEFDAKYLIRAITASRAYQLTSAISHDSQNDASHFAVMPVRRLAPEQIVESVATAVGERALFDDRAFVQFRYGTAELFSDSGASPTNSPTSVIQALSLMNGELVAQATDPAKSRMLAAVAEYPGWDTSAQIEALYLATLARPPRADESERLIAYVDAAPEGDEQKAALADVFWALLNSSEFLFNH